MKPLLILVAIAAALLAAFLIHGSPSGTQLNVTPDAGRAIEKAKQQ